MNLRKDHYRLKQLASRLARFKPRSRPDSSLVWWLSFGVAIALEASHGDGLKLERARRDASFKEVGDTPARPALSLQTEVGPALGPKGT